ncbi:serine aminopeptidase domain-containing protein [Evansella sp. AB-rgal1]|uniref:serine aminopeptidase domain-containing protein n=1 Tax=Evansella sp. AB-rgal1 TaxID=3242696 RepID=UPI00359ED797
MKEVLVQSENRVKKKRKMRNSIIIFFAILISIFLAILIVTPPLIMGDQVNRHVTFDRLYTAKEFDLHAEKLVLTTSDDLNIAAYEVFTPDPHAVIIFISGIHNPSVTAFYGHSKYLLENNYASILMEMRAHGESDGDAISLGYKEYLDTEAVVEYIKNDTRYTDVPIIVYGLSMGGATAINSIGKIPEIDGLISMSAYSSWEDAFYDNMTNMGAPAFYSAIQKPFVKIYTTWKYGVSSLHISPKKLIKQIGDKPALIMHSTGDSQVPYASFERIMKEAPSHVETWIREGDFHFIIKTNDFTNPQQDKEYAEKIMDFLNRHFNKTR